MQIKIEAFIEDKKIPEWGLVEFQGTFSTRNKDPIHGRFLGDLSFDNDGTPFFTNGHHILFGKETKMSHPYAVLEKVVDEDANETKYIVRAVVRKRVLFKSRPRPIVCD